MVESIGSTPIISGDRGALRVASVASTPAVSATVRDPSTTAETATDASATSSLTGLARQMAASAPVNTDHVEQIKKAIANGTFPILPATIADRMLAFKLNWDPNDKT